MREADRTDPEAERHLLLRGTDDEPDNTRKVTFTIALVVTVLFLLVTAAGLGWMLSGNGPLTASTDESDGESKDPGDDERTDVERAAPEDGTVSDPNSGLTYELPGEGWQRLGDDEVPPEYSTYAVYGPPEDPKAIIVTGSESLGPLEPLALTAVDMATDMVGQLVAEEGDLWVEPSGATELGDHSAFGVTMGSEAAEGDAAYGRFLVAELDGDQGAFMLGLSTTGDAAIIEDIEAAFDSASAL
ncbi:hypothetical protein [Nocardiopsis alkaliphila]|uniref:hypothetical protein n=1 Tax=Nocardiopsis alkaliphila TaxID=225762 RepID=UPI00034C599A|nr:hypothetical protein [Nocardiopsis alkaliphila]